MMENIKELIKEALREEFAARNQRNDQEDLDQAFVDARSAIKHYASLRYRYFRSKNPYGIPFAENDVRKEIEKEVSGWVFSGIHEERERMVRK